MPARHPKRAERGFALPVTVFLVTLLTLMLATGFARVRADRQIATGSEYTTEALAVAQSGLHKYMGTQTTRPIDGDSVPIIGIPGGYAEVVARVVQRPADTLLLQTYIIRSTGYVVEPSVSSEPVAQRTVAQFAVWQTGWIDAQAALTAHNGLKRSGAGGHTQGSDVDSVSGFDACGVQPAVRSVWTPVYETPSGGPWDSVTFEPSPPDESTPATSINWPATIGPGIMPDYTSIQVGSSAWAVQRVNGDATLDGTGTGLLIVTGHLTFTGGSAAWEGVILVGDSIRFAASSNRVEGLVVSGLNGTNTSTRFGGAGSTFVVRYNSCHVLQALARLTGFRTISNTWIDNWATY